MRLFGAAFAAAVLAGCGSATQASLDQASEATGEETSRIAMTYHVTGPHSQDYRFESTGVFDYRNGSGVMTTDSVVPFYGEGVELREVRLLGDAAYFKWVVKGKTYWMKQQPVETSGDPAGVLIPGPGTPTKPTDVLSRVLRASDGHQKLGREEIRHTESTHYRANVDLAELAQQLPPSERPKGSLEQYWGERVVPVNLWIDDESRLRRIAIAGQNLGEDGGELSATVDLFDYGVDVSVSPPPADETITQEDFDKIIEPITSETTFDAGKATEMICSKGDNNCWEQTTP